MSRCIDQYTRICCCRISRHGTQGVKLCTLLQHDPSRRFPRKPLHGALVWSLVRRSTFEVGFRLFLRDTVAKALMLVDYGVGIKRLMNRLGVIAYDYVHITWSAKVGSDFLYNVEKIRHSTLDLADGLTRMYQDGKWNSYAIQCSDLCSTLIVHGGSRISREMRDTADMKIASNYRTVLRASL